MVPVVPVAKGPLRIIDWTSGFHSCQVLGSDQIFHTAAGLALVSTERMLSAIFVLLESSALRRATPIQNNVYHAGDEEADEVAEIGIAEPRGEWSVGFQAEHLELFRNEQKRNQKPDHEGDQTGRIPVGSGAETHRLTMLQEVKVDQHDRQPGHDPVVQHDQKVLVVLGEVLVADQSDDERERAAHDGELPSRQADV